MMSNLPMTLDAKALARLLAPIIYQSEHTILRNVSRCPKSLPPFGEVGGASGKKIFETQQVIAFYPPGIGAAIRRTLDREWEKKTEEISAAKARPAPPAMQSLAEILMPASALVGRV